MGGGGGGGGAYLAASRYETRIGGSDERLGHATRTCDSDGRRRRRRRAFLAQRP